MQGTLSISKFALLAAVASASLALSAAAPWISAAPQAAAPTSSAQQFTVDGVHSTALFRVLHLGAGQFWGRFNDVSGTFTVNEGKPEGVTFDITIKVESVDTGNERLDGHLKGPDFFNAPEHPNLTFKSTSVKAGSKPGWLDVAGDLTMNGVTKPVNAVIEWTGTKGGPRGVRAGYEATFTVNRADWNIDYGIENGSLGADVRIIVALEGIGAANEAG